MDTNRLVPNMRAIVDESSNNSSTVAEPNEDELDETNVIDIQNSKHKDRIISGAPLKEDSQIKYVKNIDNLEPSTKPPNDEIASYNVRALTKNAETYELEKFEKNVLVIILDSENRQKLCNVPEQIVMKDIEALENTFKRFNFEVTVYKDLPMMEILSRLQAFFTQDFTHYGCVGIALLSQDYCGEIWTENNIPIHRLIHNHQNATLVTKPNFFIEQAYISKFTMIVYARKYLLEEYEEEFYNLPDQADILSVHATSHIDLKHSSSTLHYIKPRSSILHSILSLCGYVRKVSENSEDPELPEFTFIQSLCDKIDQLAATHDVESIIKEVAKDARESEPKKYTKIGTPVTTTTLIRKLYLKKFGDPILPISKSAAGTFDKEELNKEKDSS